MSFNILLMEAAKKFFLNGRAIKALPLPSSLMAVGILIKI